MTSCGYHSFEGKETTISVPYIAGDERMELQAAIIRHVSHASPCHCIQKDGAYVLQVHILRDEQERIGFRYDRDNPAGKRERNLLGVESRRTLRVDVSILHQGQTIAGPFSLRASVDMDSTNPGSPRDLLFEQKQPIMQFSLGQLDSSEGAFDDAMTPLADRMAEQIARIVREVLID